MEYIFFLGKNSPDLCFRELMSVLDKSGEKYQIIDQTGEYTLIGSSKELDCRSLINNLGGTIKIAKIIAKIPFPGLQSEIIDQIIKIVAADKRDFGLSSYRVPLDQKEIILLVKNIKEKLKEIGIRKNYVLPEEESVLSNVVVSKKKINEINLLLSNNQLIISQTQAIFDFEGFSKRDFSRPFLDPKKGMLPPKIAKIMVNISLHDLKKSSKGQITLLDPFCGMGTILAEGLLMGLKVIGADIDRESSEKSLKNLVWLEKVYQLKSSQYKVFQSDATHISQKVEKNTIDLVVTEPYLGPLIESKEKQLLTKQGRKVDSDYLKNIITGLEKLYIGALKEWRQVLKKDGIVCLIIPAFKISQNKTFFVKKPIDICEKLGYNLLESYIYCRPRAVVLRNIYFLKLI